MEEEKINGADLDEELKKLKLNLTPTQMKNNNGVCHQTHSVKNVIGVVKLASSPHFGLVLDTGSPEKPFVLPIVMVDSAKHICQWILVVGKKVWIDQLLIVFERFQNFNGCHDAECVNIVIMWEDVKILEDSTIVEQISCPPQQNLVIDLVKDNDLKANHNSSNSCRVVVHHASSPFYVGQPSAFCLVLISYTNKKLVETKLWLVLKANQVAWKEFLIPNREYLIVFPQNSSRFWFDESRKPLKAIFPSNNQALEVLFHHQQLFPTLDGSTLPCGSQLFLTSNTQFSEYVYQFVKDTPSLWFSSNEADYADAGLVTFYGQVDVIKYDYEAVFKSCYLCIRAKAKQPSLSKPNFTTTYSWTNPWNSKSSLDKDKLLALPTAEDDSGVMETGVPGNLVEIIKLRDVITGEEQSVYLKHSYISQSQQMCRLSAGMVVCITHLNRRCSTKGKYYYITTTLSSFKVLSLPNDLCHNECWGLYGLNCSATPYYQDRMWGVLETINLIKVVITAKCTSCNAIFYKGTCSEECSRPAAQTSALAIGWLQLIHNKNTISMEKVVIKDSLVRELLCIPEDMWQILLKVAVEQEIACFFSDQNWNGSPNSLDFCELFRMYCSNSKPNGKFYISVKKMASCSDSEPFYYCINLKPVEENRLKIIAELAKKVLTK